MFCVLRTCMSDHETVFYERKTIFRKSFKNFLQVLYVQILDCQQYGTLYAKDSRWLLVMLIIPIRYGGLILPLPTQCCSKLFCSQKYVFYLIKNS